MYIILCYDVAKDRDRKVLKICRQYLRSVQRSVFEGSISHARLDRLKSELAGALDPEQDAVVIYHLETATLISREQIGKLAETPNRFL